jgi:hypothetical protein
MVARGRELERIVRKYAVLWSGSDGDGSGRLEVRNDRFELSGRDAHFEIAFSDLVGASIGRTGADRLLGLPVLWLRRRDGRSLRVASLEGSGALHELVRFADGV